MLLNAVSLSYLSDAKMNTGKNTGFLLVHDRFLSEMVNRTLHQKTGRSSQILDSWSRVLSTLSTAATAASGFVAERSAGKIYRSTAAGAVQQAPALSSKCG